MVGVSDDDVHQEVVSTGDVRDPDHLIERQRLGTKHSDLIGAVASESNGDHGLEADRERSWIDVGVEASEHSGVGEPAQAF